MSLVYREGMGPAEQRAVAPAWPEFVVLRQPGWTTGIMTWYAVTNAGRPNQPYFWRPMVDMPECATDEELLAEGRKQLDAVYAEAHPNGCPKIGH